jgi:hypothetical protein
MERESPVVSTASGDEVPSVPAGSKPSSSGLFAALKLNVCLTVKRAALWVLRPITLLGKLGMVCIHNKAKETTTFQAVAATAVAAFSLALHDAGSDHSIWNLLRCTVNPLHYAIHRLSLCFIRRNSSFFDAVP